MNLWIIIPRVTNALYYQMLLPTSSPNGYQIASLFCGEYWPQPSPLCA
jgi:hypothetical protein